ncbi:MAG: histidinol phosphate phosphatase, partial [Bacillota bacterium]|nr:histidinol phosphate phosphatase [Bacillota bacterium]
IASLHVFAGEDPCYREFYERYTRSDIIKLILAETIKCLKDYSDYCALGHLDYGLSFAQNAAVLEYAEAPSLLDELLLHLIRSSKGLEVNTSGYRRSGNTLPSPSVLKRYFDLGGEIITLGSDAHRAEHVGYRFSDAAAMLKSIGFKYTAYFKDMKPYFVPMT